MRFGIQFFPDVGSSGTPADRYFREALDLVGLCDRYGYAHVRIVEHYFDAWGGYSPNPMIFLAAAAQRSRQARMITGAVLPVFSHPLKLAAEIAMLDAIAEGRLEVGFARAFLPFEYRHFGIDMNESVARFEEGIAQVRLLLEHENVSAEGRFHSFKDVTVWPRPTQKPRPKFHLAAVGTPESFARAGRLGYGLMAIPGVGHNPTELIRIYRDAWRTAGHPGQGSVMMAVFMLCDENQGVAERLAKGRIERHFEAIYAAMSEHEAGAPAADYKGYDQMAAKVRLETFEMQVAHNAAFVGTPSRIIEQMRAYDEDLGGCDELSMQVHFNDLPYDVAERSMRLFGEAVLPAFAATPALALTA